MNAHQGHGLRRAVTRLWEHDHDHDQDDGGDQAGSGHTYTAPYDPRRLARKETWHGAC
jgi:hypothetical protein